LEIETAKWARHRGKLVGEDDKNFAELQAQVDKVRHMHKGRCFNRGNEKSLTRLYHELCERFSENLSRAQEDLSAARRDAAELRDDSNRGAEVMDLLFKRFKRRSRKLGACWRKTRSCGRRTRSCGRRQWWHSRLKDENTKMRGAFAKYDVYMVPT
jgi:hypothetical protein